MNDVNIKVAHALSDIAQIKKYNGSNHFSFIAYCKAAKIVENLVTSVADIDVNEIPGIGTKIAAHIKEYISSGKIQYYEDNKHLISPIINFNDLMRIEGVGEKMALKIYKEFKITSVDELKTIISNNVIKTVFKEKTIDMLKKGIDYLDKTKGKIRLDEGIEMASEIYRYIKPFIKEISFCGSFRRSKEVISDIDIAVIAKNKINVLKKFIEMPIVDEVIDSGDKKASVWIRGVRFDCYVFTKDIYESGIMHLTGSAKHNKRLRTIAKSQGLILSQYGLYERNDKNERTGDRIDDGTELSIYNILGFEWIPPEHREGYIEFIKYKFGQPIHQMLEKEDILFDSHVHSTWSDGTSTIKELVEFAISIGLKGIAICDHSQSLKIANGLTVENLRKRNKEIDKLRLEYPNFIILKSIELEIKSDGSLDYPDDVLDELDLVVAARHSKTNDINNIYEKAIRTGKIDILAHVTGRLINKRDSHSNLDMTRILNVCKEYNVAIELNCQPDRLDANEHILKQCVKNDVPISLGSDAHKMNQMMFVHTFGLWIAKRAWLTKENLYKQTKLK